MKTTRTAPAPSTVSTPEEMVLTVPETALLLKVSERSVWRWIGSRSLPCVRLGRNVRIRRADLEAVISGRKLN